MKIHHRPRHFIGLLGKVGIIVLVVLLSGGVVLLRGVLPVPPFLLLVLVLVVPLVQLGLVQAQVDADRRDAVNTLK